MHNEECAIKVCIVSMGARDPVSYPGYVVYSIYDGLILFIFWSPAFSITADDFYTVSGGILLSLQEGSDESATIVINPPFALYGNI